MSRSRLPLLMALVFIVGVAGVCLLVGTCAPEPEGAPRPATAAVSPSPSSSGAIGSVPLLENLRPGDTIDEWTVSRMLVNESVQKKPQLAVELERKGSGMTIWIARKGDATNAPLSTASYALSFGHARPYGEPIPDDAPVKVMNLLAERVKRTEATAEPPPGL